MSSTDDDSKALEERLRQKYGGASSNNQNVIGGNTTHASSYGGGGVVTIEETAREDAANAVRIHLCHVCSGEGKETRLYDNSRVITQDCDECEGMGTITTKGGKRMTEEEAKEHRRRQVDPNDKLGQDILKLEDMQKGYERELVDLEASISKAPAEEKQLYLDVQNQVHTMLERVKGALGTKRNRKEKLLKQKIKDNLKRSSSNAGNAAED